MPKTSRRFAAADAPAPVGYTPPANPEAEQSVLGAILVRPEVMDRIADVIVPEDFYREAHGRIFKAMLDLYGRGEPVDLVTVTALLKERGQLEGAGGPVFLAGLSEQVGFATNAEYYASLVHDKSVLRRLLDCTQEIAAACLAPVENVADFLDHAEHKIFQVAESKVRPGFSPLSALVDTEIATLEAIWGRKDGSLTGVTSGFTDLDNYTAGFQPSDLIILAARPSMGKTALALNIAFNAAYGRRGGGGQSIPPVPVAFFSLEMSKEQLVRRLLSSEGRVDASQIRRAAFLTGQEWTKLQEAAGILLDCPIYIDDTPAATVLDIRAKSRRLKADGKLGMIIIDYLQLMQGRAELSSRGAADLRDFPLPEGPGQGTGGAGHRPVPAQPGAREAGTEATPTVGPAGIRRHRTGRRCRSCSSTGTRSIARTTPKTRGSLRSLSVNSATGPSAR